MRNLIAAALVILSVGCRARDVTTGTPASPTSALPGVQAVVIDGPSLVYWKSTVPLNARARLDDGETVSSEKAAWSSSDPTVASVDHRGLVSGISNGEAVISATVGAATGRFAVRVIPDYRGVWHGQTSGEYCGPWYSFTCRWITGSWETYLRIDQAGASIGAFMYYPTDMNPEDGYLFGHVEADGSLVIDRGFCTRSGLSCAPRVTSWRTVLGQDAATLTGAYAVDTGPWEGLTRALTMHRSE